MNLGITVYSLQSDLCYNSTSPLVKTSEPVSCGLHRSNATPASPLLFIGTICHLYEIYLSQTDRIITLSNSPLYSSIAHGVGLNKVKKG